MRSSPKRLVLVAMTAVGVMMPAAISSAIGGLPEYAGYAVGNHKVLVGFDLHGAGCPGSECFDHHPHLVGFGPVGYDYPACPELLDGVTELKKPVAVGRNGSFEASGQGEYPGETVKVGGRFLDEGRRARGWFIVDNGGCLSARTRWTAKLER
ncbi:MAG TPA: hypothetical protein VH476_02785 [Solirubrobacterales bacterium]|jgi:hypothetical protein